MTDARLGVSRETSEKLAEYQADIAKWSKKINLVGQSTRGHSWHRHIIDSAQLRAYGPEGRANWCDLGSGGGLPGIVLAIIFSETCPDSQVVCVESDSRKGAFLKMMIAKFHLRARVLSQRIEFAPPQNADVVTARALAPLSKLLGYSARHIHPKGRALFLKGENYSREIDLAREEWSFDHWDAESIADRGGRVVVLENIQKLEARK